VPIPRAQAARLETSEPAREARKSAVNGNLPLTQDHLRSQYRRPAATLCSDLRREHADRNVRCGMRSVVGLMMGGFAVYVVWALVRAWRERVIFSDGVGYDLDAQPMKFASTAALHGVGALLFAWLAAGGVANFLRMVLPH
jgi:hypothetical protein